MADKAHKYDIDAHYTTYVAGGGIAFDPAQKGGSQHVGKSLMLSAEDTADLVTNGLEVLGKLIKVEPDGFCVVQDEGYCSVPLDGTLTYDNANNGVVGGTVAGTVKAATAVPAIGAIRRAFAVKGDGAGKTIIKLG